MVRRVRDRIRTLPPAVVLATIVAVALVPAIAFALAPNPPTNLECGPGLAAPTIAVTRLECSTSGEPVAGYRIYVSTLENGYYRYAGETSATSVHRHRRLRRSAVLLPRDGRWRGG